MIVCSAADRKAIAFFAGLLVALSRRSTVTSFTIADRCSTRRFLSALAPLPRDQRRDDCHFLVYDNEALPMRIQQDIMRRERERAEVNRIGDIEDLEESTDEEVRTLCAERRRRAMAAELLRSRQSRLQPRKTASTSAVRSMKSTTSERWLDALRRSALRPKVETGVSSDNDKAISKVTRSVIQSTIDEIYVSDTSGRHNCPDDASSITRSMSTLAATSIGILGDRQEWKSRKDRTDMSKLTIVETDDIVIRIATSLDDLEIANLRLSVFAAFSLQQRSLFCARSCLAIAARRKRGATCLVATRPATAGGAAPLVLGSAECSFHEFYGTQLGLRRKRHSILYVTEVAVSPSARRQGIGRSLLQAIDILAQRRSIETLYLHVDVANEGAIQLYKKAGYRRVANASMFQEFTRSLNLHPGATKGRDHFLFFKDLTQCPVWLDSLEVERQKRQRPDDRVLGVFGFEIPA